MCNQDYNKQKHVHEIVGSTGFKADCSEGCCCTHNHRFATVSDEAIATSCNKHVHNVTFRTDFADGHYHEFCGKTEENIDVGGGKHVHYLKDVTDKEDGHQHKFQVATLIDSPTKFKGCDK